MEHRVVISLEEMKNILDSLDEMSIFESYDMLEQEDFLWIKEDNQIKAVVALSRRSLFYVSNTSERCGLKKRSFYCIVIDMSEYKIFLEFEELVLRYCKGGIIMANKKRN